MNLKAEKEKKGALSCVDYILILLNVSMRVYCGLFMIISDCDETYNYWEPLHFLTRGFGKQTWEYSPEFSIRSYFYLIPYYLITSPLRDYVALTHHEIPPYFYFYVIRVVALSGFTSLCEIVCFKSLRYNISGDVARWFLLISSVSAGMGHASSALLPSSYAMDWVLLGTSFALYSFKGSYINGSHIKYSVLAIISYLTGGIVGWPFALALGVPFGLYTVWVHKKNLVIITLLCGVFTSVLVACIMMVDSFYYKQNYAFVPLNIVLYNIFSKNGEGPEIFGTEPFTYYLRNLLLNFNVLFIAAYIAFLPTLKVNSHKLERIICVMAPIFIWSFVFGFQAHKEERFLYPIYPLIAISAAFFFVDLFGVLSEFVSFKRPVILGKILAAFIITVILCLRIISLVENYSAPLHVAKAVSQLSDFYDQSATINVCTGREWYHFPTSFFLPKNFRLRFVKSSFDGLLPGDFREGVPIQHATSCIPIGMNAKNQFSSDKVVEFEACDLLIDNSIKSNTAVGDPDVWVDDNNLRPEFEIHYSTRMINSAAINGGIGRIIHIPRPFQRLVPTSLEYMNLCVLKIKDDKQKR